MPLYRVRYGFTGMDVTGGATSTVYFDADGGSPAQAAAAANAWWTAAKVVMRTSLLVTLETEVVTIDVNDGDATAVTNVAAFGVAGTNDTTPSAAQVQGVLRLRTGEFYNGREVRGRIYIPGIGQGAFNNTGWQSGYKATLDTAGAALISDANSTLVIWHRPQWDSPPPHSGPPDRAGSFKVVTSASLWTKTASLRSRRD